MATTPTSVTPGVQVKKEKEYRIFCGPFPAAMSFMTPKGTPVFFYKGYHVATRSEVIEFCQQLDNVEDVTATMKLEDIPQPPPRQSGNWQAAAKSEITPAELLQRVAVLTSRQVTTAAESNS